MIVLLYLGTGISGIYERTRIDSTVGRACPVRLRRWCGCAGIMTLRILVVAESRAGSSPEGGSYDRESSKTLFCPCCGRETVLVEVHGHGQCAQCGINIEPCCQGAPLENN